MARSYSLDTLRRYLTLKTHKIYSLPVVILMSHSGCNCRCVMCDIWQGSANPRQLAEADVRVLLASLKKLRTRWVVMSGGEALLNPAFFQLCDLLRSAGLKVTLLSTGLLLKKYAADVAGYTDEVIVSLDGPPAVHDRIRRVPGAFEKLEAGVQAVKELVPEFPLSARCVIQRLNYADWPNIVGVARSAGLDQISFLPADVTSEAFNRLDPWSQERVVEVKLDRSDLPRLGAIIERLLVDHAADFESGFIAESPAKIERIYQYYAALQGLAPFPQVRCNAPWVSAVVEADGTIRPCFFHPAQGHIHTGSLAETLNGPAAVAFRRRLDLDTDPICRHCVCSLNLRPAVKVGYEAWPGPGTICTCIPGHSHPMLTGGPAPGPC